VQMRMPPRFLIQECCQSSGEDGPRSQAAHSQQPGLTQTPRPGPPQIPSHWELGPPKVHWGAWLPQPQEPEASGVAAWKASSESTSMHRTPNRFMKGLLSRGARPDDDGRGNRRTYLRWCGPLAERVRNLTFGARVSFLSY
jgi:hypothetical protein